jgi:hypothetical protein
VDSGARGGVHLDNRLQIQFRRVRYEPASAHGNRPGTYIGFKPNEAPKGLQAKSIEPQTAVANQLTTFTIKGANLAGAAAVEFVLGANTKPISTFKSPRADEELVFDATLEKGKWTVNVKPGAGESVTLAQTVAVT